MRLTWVYELLVEGSDSKLELTERGSDFIDHEFGAAVAFLDEQEGLIELLTFVAEAGPARRPALREPWADYLGRHSGFRARTTIGNTLSSRLRHLLDRDLVSREGSEYSITEAGLDYLRRVDAPAKTSPIPADINSAMTKATLDAYLAAAQEKRDGIYSAELYKEEDLAKSLKSARAAVLRDDDDWPKVVTKAIKHSDNNIIFYVNKTKLANWIADDQAKAREALSALWSEGDRPAGDRVRSFDAIVPETVCPRSAVGTRLTWASYLMMGVDPHRYPPYQRTPFTKTYRRLRYPMPTANDAGGVYEHALGFLDRLIEEARKRGMDKPSTRLDAQSVVWQLREEPMEPGGMLFGRWVYAHQVPRRRRAAALPRTRGAILTGTGTGKTRIAKAVAEHFQPTVTRRVPTKIPADAIEEARKRRMDRPSTRDAQSVVWQLREEPVEDQEDDSSVDKESILETTGFRGLTQSLRRRRAAALPRTRRQLHSRPPDQTFRHSDGYFGHREDQDCQGGGGTFPAHGDQKSAHEDPCRCHRTRSEALPPQAFTANGSSGDGHEAQPTRPGCAGGRSPDSDTVSRGRDRTDTLP